MTATFLESEFSHMFWIDSDIVFEPEDVVKIWNLEADIGIAAYPMKNPDERWYAAWTDKLVKDLDKFSGPTEVQYAGTGFMLIKREVLETLAKKSETYNKGRVPVIYTTPVYNDFYQSEDYSFCRRAREAGFKIMMDPSVRLGHIGSYTFGG